MEPYSFLDAILAGFREHYVASGWICTEYVASILDKCGYNFPISAQVPEDFIIFLNESKKQSVYIEK